MRLIDADKLHQHRVWIASIKKGEYNGMKSAVVVFTDEIDKNKKARVDAVPVVRCKDCANYAGDGMYCAWGLLTGDMGYCHHGCTVQVLRNSVTGETSVGWWKEKEGEK